MGTPYSDVFNRFLSKILEDEWEGWAEEDIERDLSQILESAIPWFKFPRNPLDRNEDGFINTLTDREQEILASYMKVEWLNRSIMTWQNIKPLYDERDFSQANMLAKLTTALENEKKKAHFLESNYYRSINNKPYDYSKLAGSKNG